MTEEPLSRLNKELALLLGVSRREADLLIEKRRVRINDDVAVLGARLAPRDRLYVDHKPVARKAVHLTIALNKPVGYVSSRRRQGETPTIYELLPPQYHHLKPVGRLDKDSSGLILLSNDGDFAYQMTHPKFFKVKRYEVSLDHALEPLHQQMIADYGLQLPDGPSKLSLEAHTDDSRRHWVVTMHEGRNRQIRRTFAALGYTVTALHRTNFGNYSLGDISPGSFQEIHIH